ncbi:(2Fe-2S)-binding protein [Brevundimonas sp. AJA228-03]|uniref:BFD domain protein (2Fe-2S)-binding domain protein n=1 Tax=Brevundimonas subvibrioides (strain ATCC 15264 / DSM 4735 / LMG 14903 / NBRC 16000 / CB 81) TaxID=633149 RepID=D9QGC5_BRESC|nr:MULTISPECIES: (2Fe-2S)-binding protein [Brevundimonas]ADL00741.1 BFD domain protein (2Fe-2S)-binding domain protein [Brevundimonas subvibrioides ATCC 15264]QTN19038.1 (2Fe-2S)-binding protein [Brevundimonas sp. AJA228-03]
MYVCNCNGLRQRDVARAIEAGATRPADVFQRNQCAAQCAKCVCEMRQMIQDSRDTFALAAE